MISIAPEKIWILCGDFNEVRFSDEWKWSYFSTRGAHVCNTFILSSGLMEITLGGRKYTWMNKDSQITFVIFGLTFPPSTCRDYSPTTIQFYLTRIAPILGLSHFGALKNDIKCWRACINNFNNDQIIIIKTKVVTLDVLADDIGIDDDSIYELEDTILKIHDLEKSKILDIRQKTRGRDDNFFHGLVNINVKHSRINGLNISGVWVTYLVTIKKLHHSRPYLRSNKFRDHSLQERYSLEAPFITFITDEIEEVVWGCGSDKCPRPDGFSYNFIKTYWDTIVPNIVQVVKFFE
uniref:Endonuclease/exonuclease/phosphatase domain-containing protein n=1 Tax=Lactuca sativa TaxID=4236 RepID=A0A9R1XCM9_LACSA|nr:hypothetical protein LSAT_V11C500251390 [Lactuca sativa]